MGQPVPQGPKLDFGQNLNGLAIDQGAKHGVHQFLYGHGQAETPRKIAVVSTYPANALSPALSKLAKVELRSQLELYIVAQLGSEYLVSKKSQTELRAVSKEIAHLRKKLAALEARKTALERAIKR